MEKMEDLKDLLKHQIMDLYSAEAQIIDALPSIIDKCRNKDLKKSLEDHLKITEKQKDRLDKIQRILDENIEENKEKQKQGILSRLFGGSEEAKCKAMEGLITEGQRIMRADISPDVLDAAIIGSVQKIEHYEIAGYGTARAYARELKFPEIQKLLEQTLKEEYEANDLLTKLALDRVNIQAEMSTTTSAMEETTAKPGLEKSKGVTNASVSNTKPQVSSDNRASSTRPATKERSATNTTGNQSSARKISGKGNDINTKTAKRSSSDARNNSKGHKTQKKTSSQTASKNKNTASGRTKAGR